MKDQFKAALDRVLLRLNAGAPVRVSGANLPVHSSVVEYARRRQPVASWLLIGASLVGGYASYYSHPDRQARALVSNPRVMGYVSNGDRVGTAGLTSAVFDGAAEELRLRQARIGSSAALPALDDFRRAMEREGGRSIILIDKNSVVASGLAAKPAKELMDAYSLKVQSLDGKPYCTAVVPSEALLNPWDGGDAALVAALFVAAHEFSHCDSGTIPSLEDRFGTEVKAANQADVARYQLWRRFLDETQSDLRALAFLAYAERVEGMPPGMARAVTEYMVLMRLRAEPGNDFYFGGPALQAASSLLSESAIAEMERGLDLSTDGGRETLLQRLLETTSLENLRLHAPKTVLMEHEVLSERLIAGHAALGPVLGIVSATVTGGSPRVAAVLEMSRWSGAARRELALLGDPEARLIPNSIREFVAQRIGARTKSLSSEELDAQPSEGEGPSLQ